MDEREKLSLQTPMNELEERLLKENDTEELQRVVDLFNLNIKKKDILRASKLSGLQDAISEQMADRVNKHAGEFSNKDLLDYFKTISDTVSKAGSLITPDTMPAIQINQSNVNISVGGATLNQASKEKVVDRVKDLLKKYGPNGSEVIDVEDADIKDVEEST